MAAAAPLAATVAAVCFASESAEGFAFGSAFLGAAVGVGCEGAAGCVAECEFVCEAAASRNGEEAASVELPEFFAAAEAGGEVASGAAAEDCLPARTCANPGSPEDLPACTFEVSPLPALLAAFIEMETTSIALLHAPGRHNAQRSPNAPGIFVLPICFAELALKAILRSVLSEGITALHGLPGKLCPANGQIASALVIEGAGEEHVVHDLLNAAKFFQVVGGLQAFLQAFQDFTLLALVLDLGDLGAAFFLGL